MAFLDWNTYPGKTGESRLADLDEPGIFLTLDAGLYESYDDEEALEVDITDCLSVEDAPITPRNLGRLALPALEFKGPTNDYWDRLQGT